MNWNDDGFLEPIQTADIENDNDLFRVCPFNIMPEETVKDEDELARIFLPDASQADDSIGHFLGTYVGFSNEFRITSSSGGLATYIFKRLLEENIVDRLFVVSEAEGTYRYQLLSKIEDITVISKTRYIPVTLASLFDELESINGRVAVSGVACFIKAIRLKQHYHPKLKEKIPFLVGIVCGGLKSRFFTDYLAQRAGISTGYRNPEYRLKDENSTASDYSFGALDKNNVFHQVKMRTLGDMWGTGLFKANACDYCTDVLTELADISLGDAWLDEYRSDGLGNSVIVTRSPIADLIVKNGIENGDLTVKQVDKSLIAKSQKSSFSHRRDGLKLRVLLRKISFKKVPYLRKHVKTFPTVLFSLVQLQRTVTRRKSIGLWRKVRNAHSFDAQMKLHLRILSLLTLLYHKFR
ncbi:Coenzyme F420 hydrogenase/dehydrogenase, beta subunit C-terminal domain [Parapedobacter sp. GCM10030251]|uniref:Coenzyme F420 hydrogenase/dehydrogenase, beta subunit C-terminal domain n=1 Tax=Parapedobacter sp. GCM10030251 TaxID=3273419 RepID=UPI00362346FB